MLNCAVVIVTFFPEQSSIKTIETYTVTCSFVVVVDNTPRTSSIKFPEADNLLVVRLGANMGLAAALNQGIHIAGKKGYQNIFLFDQDSSVSSDFFTDMLLFKKETDKKYTNCAICVPNFFDRNSQTFSKFPVIGRFRLKHFKCGNSRSVPAYLTVMAITSGSLLDYEKVKIIGGMREDYFIDFLDNEYCMRVYVAGYRISINCKVILDHAIGNRVTKKFLFLTVKPNHHLPVRRYYITRNGLRTAFDYKKAYPSYFLLITARLIHELLSIIFYENLKKKKLKAMLWGFFHSLSKTMGKCLIGGIAAEDPQ